MAAIMTACGISSGAQRNDDRGRGDKGRGSSDVLEFAYALQVLDGDGKTQTVREDTRMRSGDRFGLLVKANTPLHLYIFNRGPGDGNYVRLFPSNGQTARISPSWDTPLRLPQDRDAWLRLDKKAGNEQMVIIASKSPIDRLESSNRIRRDQVEDTLAEIERNQRPRDLQRWEDGNWTRWKTDSQQPGLVLVCRIPLLHR